MNTKLNSKRLKENQHAKSESTLLISQGRYLHKEDRCQQSQDSEQQMPNSASTMHQK